MHSIRILLKKQFDSIMTDVITQFENEEQLEEALSRPSDELVELFAQLEGDIMFLGVAGKMGISMAHMAKRAVDASGKDRRVIGVSRFSNERAKDYLESLGVETIAGDLLDQDFLNGLPEVGNVIYLAGMKFGTEGNQSTTWAMNAYLPGLVANRFKNSKIVALSTGCVYPLVSPSSGGSKETDHAMPVGEYAQSCLGRERLFEFGSSKFGTQGVLIRLNYAVEMRYGVLVDIAMKVYDQQPIDLTMGYVNVIWQGDANNRILRSLAHCTSPINHLNISGGELLSVASLAKRFGELMAKPVELVGKEANSALLSNIGKSTTLFGLPETSIDDVVQWTSKWVVSGKPLLGKATHFEVRDGKY